MKAAGKEPHSEPATILGTVTDINDDPVAGATISLQGPEPSDVRTVTTNDDGLFEIRDVSREFLIKSRSAPQDLQLGVTRHHPEAWPTRNSGREQAPDRRSEDHRYCDPRKLR